MSNQRSSGDFKEELRMVWLYSEGLKIGSEFLGLNSRGPVKLSSKPGPDWVLKGNKFKLEIRCMLLIV